MGFYRNFFVFEFIAVLFLAACDLQPKIYSIPDSIGAFISDRYPALLADPIEQPEIYNSAVTDYGVYASPELYGSSNIDDYVMYASIDDYVLAPSDESTEIDEKNEVSAKTEEDTESEENDYLIVPTYGGFFEEAKEPVEQKTEPKTDSVTTDKDIVVIARGDTLYSIAKNNNTSVKELAELNSLREPYTLSIGQKLRIRGGDIKAQEKIENVISQERVNEIKSEKKPVILTKKESIVEKVKPTDVKRVDLQEITVIPGDTLYSLSRKYEIPVNDLAVMNKLSNPFTLSIGQKLKVPKLDNVEIRSAGEIKEIKIEKTKQVSVQKISDKGTKKSDNITPAKAAKTDSATRATEKKDVKKSEKSTPKQTVKKENVKSSVKSETKTKISSNPKKQLPKISARSSSKFSWPVRGKILSQYGAKSNGLFNDGINISAARGSAVKSAENGVVAYAGNEVKGMGNLIIIQHSDGWMTVYAHLDSMSVKRGTKVSVGQQIGSIGQTGKVDKPQLHFEIRKGTKAYNPITYLKK